MFCCLLVWCLLCALVVIVVFLIYFLMLMFTISFVLVNLCVRFDGLLVYLATSAVFFCCVTWCFVV